MSSQFTAFILQVINKQHCRIGSPAYCCFVNVQNQLRISILKHVNIYVYLIKGEKIKQMCTSSINSLPVEKPIIETSENMYVPSLRFIV